MQNIELIKSLFPKRKVLDVSDSFVKDAPLDVAVERSRCHPSLIFVARKMCHSKEFFKKATLLPQSGAELTTAILNNGHMLCLTEVRCCSILRSRCSRLTP